MRNQLHYLTFIGRDTDPGELLVEDRRRPHCDHFYSNGLETRARVDVGRSVNRIVKDVVCFHGEDFEKIVERLKIDIYQQAISQKQR
ncbi:unnamed protein product [Rotaria sordida]|uniref:Uncharacterized protein n=1 Tax=Rotaria sordida TaxID=392033 RepID=A0A816C1S8_9BILA|nr:unnamed protein product [Rotaria sordida]CAF1615989.1 unnamed protein product [Rotaria sordida]CAF1617238.1 unnamed protein product [Rotaria sordida]